METIVPVIVAAAGLVLYGLTSGKASEVGRIAYGVGLLVTVAAWAHHAIHLP